MARTLLLRKLTRLLKLATQELRLHQGDDRRHQGRASALNRRDFLQAGMIGASLPGLLMACQTPGPADSAIKIATPSTARSITVVGAGTAGLTSAYSLAKAGHASGIYEASSRLGGRMFTMPNFNAGGMFCELGGEFVDTQHTDLIELCHELKIGIEDLVANEKTPRRELYFSHQRIRTEAEIIRAFKPLAARLLIDAKTISPKGELEVPTYQSELAKLARVQELDRMSLAQYLEQSHIETWLADLLSNAYVGEYGLETGEQSALNMIILINPETGDGFEIFGSSDEAKRISGGSGALPQALAKAIEGIAPIAFEHKLIAVRDNGVELTLVFDNRGKTIETKTKKLILALPASLLKDVDMGGLELSPVKKRAIAEWGFGTNSKLMLGFNKRIWDKDLAHRGFSLTPDQAVQEFWDTSLGQAGDRGIVTCFLGGTAGHRILPKLQTQSLDFLNKVFPGIKAAFDGKKVLQHWPSQEFSRGSYTCSRPGQYTSIYGSFAEAELQGRLIFAGEHCSTDWSGYMNGAIQSGKQAAESLLNPV